jgi:hypothetical protein
MKMDWRLLRPEGKSARAISSITMSLVTKNTIWKLTEAESVDDPGDAVVLVFCCSSAWPWSYGRPRRDTHTRKTCFGDRCGSSGRSSVLARCQLAVVTTYSWQRCVAHHDHVEGQACGRARLRGGAITGATRVAGGGGGARSTGYGCRVANIRLRGGTWGRSARHSRRDFDLGGSSAAGHRSIGRRDLETRVRADVLAIEKCGAEALCWVGN